MEVSTSVLNELKVVYSLVFKKLYSGLYGKKQYGKGMMVKSTSAFRKHANVLNEKVQFVDPRLHSVWIVPAKFNCSRFMDNPRKVDSEVMAQDGTDSPKQTANVTFEQRDSANNT